MIFEPAIWYKQRGNSHCTLYSVNIIIVYTTAFNINSNATLFVFFNMIFPPFFFARQIDFFLSSEKKYFWLKSLVNGLLIHKTVFGIEILLLQVGQFLVEPVL